MRNREIVAGGNAKAASPSYLDLSPDEKFVYAVNEDANDKGSTYQFSHSIKRMAR